MKREISINDIDSKTRDVIVKVLRFNHVTPTTERIVSYYLGAIHGLTIDDKPSKNNSSKLCSYEEFIPFECGTKVTSTRALRKLFWLCYPESKKKIYSLDKRQNDYPTDVRCAWVDFIELCLNHKVITQHLADITTL